MYLHPSNAVSANAGGALGLLRWMLCGFMDALWFLAQAVFGGPAMDALDNLLKAGYVLMIRLEPSNIIPANPLFNRTGHK